MRSPKPVWAIFSVVATVFVLGATFFFVGCEGDEGPMGPAGESGTSACMGCHTDAEADSFHIIARTVQWQNSLHFTGGHYERNTVPCADCHTHEGFLAKLSTGASITPANPGPIGCFTCHAPHTRGDFALRTIASVAFLHDGGTYDYESSNLCANCHQARPLDPPISAAPDSTTIRSSRWGPHHSNQGNMLAGKGGYEYSGFNYTNSYHTVGVREAGRKGCIACHMSAPYGSKAGGHQMGLVYDDDGEEVDWVAGCNVVGCHGIEDDEDAGLEDFNPTSDADHDGDGEIEGIQDEIEGLVEKLRAELFARGLIDEENLVVASRQDPLKISAAEAGAIYNFLYVYEDQSLGIHNANYAIALLQSALDNLP